MEHGCAVDDVDGVYRCEYDDEHVYDDDIRRERGDRCGVWGAGCGAVEYGYGSVGGDSG